MVEEWSGRGDSPSPAGSQTTAALLDPMSRFYALAGRPLPQAEAIVEAALPAAVRPLLVHDEEMTRRLERHCATTVGLRVLARVRTDVEYARHVVLTRAGADAGLVLAAVVLRLERLPPAARAAVLAEREPLGHILHREYAAVRRLGDGYLRVRPDALVRAALPVDGAPWVYGRRGRLQTGDGMLLGAVIELTAGADPRP
jgi:chorismate-pyruvate lyase